MLILTSNGLSSTALLKEASQYTSFLRTAAIVTTASLGHKEKDRHIPRIAKELEQIGLQADCFDIETQNPEELREYDVVEINGGNPFYLLQQMRLQRAEETFRSIAREQVLIGISAGSLVLQQSIDLIAGYSPEMNDAVQLRDFTGLGITDLEILPHYHRFLSRFDQFEERAQAYEQTTGRNVIRLDDGEGVFVTGHDACIIRA